MLLLELQWQHRYPPGASQHSKVVPGHSGHRRLKYFCIHVCQQKQASSKTLCLGSVSSNQSLSSVSLKLHGLQNVRLPCQLPTPRIYSNLCTLSRWCCPTISSSVVSFSSCLQPFPASGSFPMRQFFASGDQSIGVSASTSVIPMNIEDWFPLGWTGWISLQSKGLSRVFSNTTSILQCSAFFIVQLSHPYMTTGKTLDLTRWTFVGKVMSLLFNMLSRLVLTFLPRSKRLLI